MSFFTSPTSFRLANLKGNSQTTNFIAHPVIAGFSKSSVKFLDNGKNLPPHSSHTAFGHLILLVFEAVLEVVCVSLPGYIVAWQGMFDADMQKFTANLNVQLFTPCLSKPLRHSLPTIHLA